MSLRSVLLFIQNPFHDGNLWFIFRGVEKKHKKNEIIDPDSRGGRLRRLREERGLSLKELSALSGISISTLSNYETNKAWPKPSYLHSLARALKADVSALSGRALSEQETGLNELPHLWIRTNFSNPSIPINPVDRRQYNEAKSLLQANYDHLGKLRNIQQLSHATGSTVLHIKCEDGAYEELILKLYHTQGAMNDLARALEIQDKLGRGKVFGRFGSFLRPLPTKGEKLFFYGEKTGVLCRCVPGVIDKKVTHFTGATLSEIKSTAEKLAQVNGVLASELVLTEPHETSPSKTFESVLRAVSDQPFIYSRSHYLAKSERDLLEKTAATVVEWLKGHKASLFRNSLYDCHPHNVFVQDEKCILILDYAGIRSDWPEVATASLALHRLSREYVRQKFKPYEAPRGSLEYERERAVRLSKEAIHSFVEGYEVRPAVARALKKEAAGWATAINFHKLIAILGFRLLKRSDEHLRNEHEHFKFIVSYISYLQELQLFEQALKQI